MSDLIADFQFPRWWMSVVVAGILVNIIATYLLRFVDVRLTKTSSWWRRRNASAQQERHAIVEALRSERDGQTQFEVAEMRSRLRSLVFLVQSVGMGVLFVVAGLLGARMWLVTASLGMCALLWFLHAKHLLHAERLASLIWQVHQLDRKP